MKGLFRILCAPALLCAGTLAAADVAQAQSFRVRVGGFQFGYNQPYGGYGGGSCYGRGRSYFSGPVYHPPSVHYDQIYHPDYYHWTPGRGVHSHGHYHTVPHYVPGHYDRWHGDHVDPNPHYHHYGY